MEEMIGLAVPYLPLIYALRWFMISFRNKTKSQWRTKKRLTKKSGVRQVSSMCQAVGCTKFSEWIVTCDILGKKNVEVYLCKKHSNTKKPLEVRISTTEQPLVPKN